MVVATTPSRAHVERPPGSARLTLPLLTFCVLTFGWTWGLWAAVTLIGASAPRLSGALFLASAFGPGLGAFVTVLAFEGKTGFIPAWAGNRTPMQSVRCSMPVHPCVGGEQPTAPRDTPISGGSSPRGRGTASTLRS